jgi:ketosteroid isomerase-like protein
MAGKPAVELAREWFAHAEEGDAEGMGSLLSADAVFYQSFLRGHRFEGREDIEHYFASTGFEAVAYDYTAIDDEYVVVTLSLRRTINGRRGLADTTLAMVFKAEGDEIVCMDAFTTAGEAFASLDRG